MVAALRPSRLAFGSHLRMRKLVHGRPHPEAPAQRASKDARLSRLTRRTAELMERARGVRASPGCVSFKYRFDEAERPARSFVSRPGRAGIFRLSPLPHARRPVSWRPGVHGGADPWAGGSLVRQAPDGWVYVPHPHLSLQARLTPLLQPRSIASTSPRRAGSLRPLPATGCSDYARGFGASDPGA